MNEKVPDLYANLGTYCRACGSMYARRVMPREGLVYYFCKDCGHYEKEQSVADSTTAFAAAQQHYYGDGSILLSAEPLPFDKEMMRKRFAVLQKYLKPASHVLEVGPGAGHIVAWLLAHGHSVVGLEHSPTLSKQLAERFEAKIINDEFETTNLEHATFDAFCSFHVIEHVNDPLAHLARAFALVKPDGYAFIATPNSRSLQQLCAEKLSPNFDSAHTFVFSARSLHLIAEQAGWTVISVMTPDYASGWLRVITKAIRRLKHEDEEITAGKYAAGSSFMFRAMAALITGLTWPVRMIQGYAGYGNEIILVLQKQT